jgi:four helix bundle protein
MADFRKLRVWQEARRLSFATAKAIDSLRGEAVSIVRKQLLRSTFSIQANIAEGSSKKSDREFARFLRIALGSSTESANHLIVLHDLEAIDDDVFTALEKRQETVGKMLSGLEKRLSGEKEGEHARQRPDDTDGGS